MSGARPPKALAQELAPQLDAEMRWNGGPVLAIESSCDETACAILDADGSILAEQVLSQQDHLPYGGVVPEIAARAHLAHLPALVGTVLQQAGLAPAGLAPAGLGQAGLAPAGLAPAGLGAVAASCGPGLIGGLIVGSNVAKGLALSLGVPFVAVNHLEAHALTARLPGLVTDGSSSGAPFPYLLLLVSGGHCQCVAVEGLGRYRRLGGTIDDAAGEAFDKVAKMLGLGWPGGPALERLAQRGNPDAIRLPRPLLGRPGCDFSFSGLKTAVGQRIAALPAPLLDQHQADLAAGFQAAVTDVLADRVAHALDALPEARLLVVAGGVAANQAIRSRLTALARQRGIGFAAPPLRLCTDNAVMVAWAAIERLRAEPGADGLDAPPRPRWPLGEIAPPGPGEAAGEAAGKAA